MASCKNKSNFDIHFGNFRQNNLYFVANAYKFPMLKYAT